jgi:hypothetical protein
MASDKTILVTGKSLLDGKTYACRVLKSAYPDAILKGLGFTKLAANATIPSTTTIINRNRISDYFDKVRLITANGKSVERFVGDANIFSFAALVGKTLISSKIIGLKWVK